MRNWLCMFALLAALWSARPLRAQGNYEIQVYGSDTVAPGTLRSIQSDLAPCLGQDWLVQ